MIIRKLILAIVEVNVWSHYCNSCHWVSLSMIHESTNRIMTVYQYIQTWCVHQCCRHCSTLPTCSSLAHSWSWPRPWWPRHVVMSVTSPLSSTCSSTPAVFPSQYRHLPAQVGVPAMSRCQEVRSGRQSGVVCVVRKWGRKKQQLPCFVLKLPTMSQKWERYVKIQGYEMMIRKN